MISITHHGDTVGIRGRHLAARGIHRCRRAIIPDRHATARLQSVLATTHAEITRRDRNGDVLVARARHAAPGANRSTGPEKAKTQTDAYIIDDPPLVVERI